MCQIEINTQSEAAVRLAIICTTIACLLMLTANVAASTDSTAGEDAYVDSVYSWGIWELGFEPATGPQMPANSAIKDRSRRLQFRPNDNAAYTTLSVPFSNVTTLAPPPPVPVAPPKPIPVSVPVAPPKPIPVSVPVAPPVPVIGPGGSGPIIPGAIPTAPNRRR